MQKKQQTALKPTLRPLETNIVLKTIWYKKSNFSLKMSGDMTSISRARIRVSMCHGMSLNVIELCKDLPYVMECHGK